MDGDLTSYADIHNHLVPGVDDGARTVEDVLDAVGRMVKLGIRKIITTPHLDGSLSLEPDRLEARLGPVTEAFERAAEAVGERFPAVEFRRGHEVMLDVPDVRFDDPRMRMAGTSFALVEWPRHHLPPGTPEVLKRIRDDGVRPIVAHPERYVGADLSVLAAWKEAGAYLQVNYGSLLSRYGAEARTRALRLVRRGWADYMASDFHGRPDRHLYAEEAWTRVEELDGREALVHLCLTNPARVLRDEEPLPVPSLPEERGFWAKVREFLSAEPA